jgi:hypothetical protein
MQPAAQADASADATARVVGPIKKEHTTSGLAVATAAYGFGMALGIRQAALGGYARIFAPAGPGAQSGVLLAALVALFLLAVRFFWVPRSLYSYAVVTKTGEVKKRFFRLMAIHFPVVVVHAILFFAVCQLFAELAMDHSAAQNPIHLLHLESELVLVYGVLLALNGVWLMSMTPTNDPMPGYFWGMNNVGFVVIAVVLWFVLPVFMPGMSDAVLTIVVLGLYVLNGVVDLLCTSQYYILFDSEIARSTTLNTAERFVQKCVAILDRGGDEHLDEEIVG